MNLSKYVRVIQGNDSTILFNTINASIIEFTYQKSNDINILYKSLTRLMMLLYILHLKQMEHYSLSKYKKYSKK